MINFEIKGISLKPFTLEEKFLMDQYLSLMDTQLSDYSFTSNFIWLSHASGFYSVINDTFCLFILSGNDISMLLPPLGKKENIPEAMVECFDIMNTVNTHRNSSRIDYVCDSFFYAFVEYLEEGTDIFEILQDYIAEKKLADYVYNVDKLIELKGNSYHTKRTEINKFKKIHENYKIEIFDPKVHKEGVNELFHRWVSERMKYMPKDMLDSFFDGVALERYAIKRLIDNYEYLGVVAVVLKIDEQICGFTAGEKLNDTTASVLFEKTDFEILGSAQFIFREFCKVLKDIYNIEQINVGDDMGFENLRKVKLSYRPQNLIPKYSIYQK